MKHSKLPVIIDTQINKILFRAENQRFVMIFGLIFLYLRRGDKTGYSAIQLFGKERMGFERDFHTQLFILGIDFIP